MQRSQPDDMARYASHGPDRIATRCRQTLWHGLRIPLILISHSSRSRSPIPVILIMLFTMPEEGTADSMTWRWTATTDG